MNNHEIPDLDRQGLRQFGITTGLIVAVLFGLFFPWVLEAKFPLWPWAIFAALGLWGLIAPASLKPVYRGWMRFGLLLSKVTTPLILGIVYYALIMPIGLVMKLFGRDPMYRQMEANRESYRVESELKAKDHMERPF